MTRGLAGFYSNREDRHAQPPIVGHAVVTRPERLTNHGELLRLSRNEILATDWEADDAIRYGHGLSGYEVVVPEAGTQVVAGGTAQALESRWRPRRTPAGERVER